MTMSVCILQQIIQTISSFQWYFPYKYRTDHVDESNEKVTTRPCDQAHNAYLIG